jgi:site-specific recombinase XerD
LKTKWDGPFLYEPPNGDLKKDWFVWFKYEHPVTGVSERFRYNRGFNTFNTKGERRDHGKVLLSVIDTLLEEGYTPYLEYLPLQNLLNKQKTIVICIDKYLKEVEADLRPNTLTKYTLELKVFQSWLIENGHGQLLLNDARKATVLDFLNEMKDKRSWSGKTYNHYLTDITTFFNYFHKNYDEYIEKVPSIHLKRARVDSPGNSAFNDWQFKKLKDMMTENGDQLLYNFCSFIYYAALRSVSEANKIKAGDFNFKLKTLKIYGGTAKNRKTEYIPLYPDFLELLYELKIDQMHPDHYIFARDRKGAFLGGVNRVGDDYFRRIFKPYKVALNLSKRDGIYGYKHTRAIHLGEDGEDLYKIMKLFRHGDLATTMIYMRNLGVNTAGAEFKKGRKF